MKYLNSLVFLGLMVMVAGCRKKDNAQPKKAAKQPAAKAVKDKKGPKKLEAKEALKGCGCNSKAKKDVQNSVCKTCKCKKCKCNVM